MKVGKAGLKTKESPEYMREASGEKSDRTPSAQAVLGPRGCLGLCHPLTPAREQSVTLSAILACASGCSVRKGFPVGKCLVTWFHSICVTVGSLPQVSLTQVAVLELFL
jgi:hypothetical protein